MQLSAGHGKGSVSTQNQPAVVAVVVVLPEILVFLELEVGDDRGAAPELGFHGGTIATWNGERPDVAVVLSGGGIDGVLLELGELDEIFASARFPFRHDRHVPTLVVRADPGDEALDPTFRGDEPWPEDRKQALIERGYRLTDEGLATAPKPLCRGKRSRCDAAAKRTPLGVFAVLVSALADTRTCAPIEVGRGPGRRAGPMPMNEAARECRGLGWRLPLRGAGRRPSVTVTLVLCPSR